MKRTAKEMKCNLIFEEFIIPQKLIPQKLITLGYFFPFAKVYSREILRFMPSAKVYFREMLRFTSSAKVYSRETFFPRKFFPLRYKVFFRIKISTLLR